jgi:hypothetical protein
MDALRQRARIGGLTIEGPVEGCCPACGNVGSIYRETEGAAAGLGQRSRGLVGRTFEVVGDVLGSGTVRLRCAKCDCRFPAPSGIAGRVLKIVALGVAMAVVELLLVTYHVPVRAWIARNPMILFIIGGFVGSALVLIACVRMYKVGRPGA